MIKPTGKETMDAGKVVYYTGRFQLGEYAACHGGPQGSSGKSGVRGEKPVGKGLSHVFREKK